MLANKPLRCVAHMKPAAIARSYCGKAFGGRFAAFIAAVKSDWHRHT